MNQIDYANNILTVRPATTVEPVKAKSTLRSLTAPGQYSSRSVFREAANDQCEITYVMELGADLPRPLGLQFVPGTVLNRIADNITHHRMNEIIEGFISRSIATFPH